MQSPGFYGNVAKNFEMSQTGAGLFLTSLLGRDVRKTVLPVSILSRMLAKIHVTLKNGVLDPQGKAVHHALNDLGFGEVSDVNVGKYLELKLDGVSKEEAESRVKEMCDRLLANTVIESYRFNLEP